MTRNNVASTALAELESGAVTDAISSYSSYSRFAQRIRRRYASELHFLPPGLPDRLQMALALKALRNQGLEVGAALRVLRQVVLERLLCLDCDAATPMADITQSMTTLAELALDVACTQAQTQLELQHGKPVTPHGEQATLWVIGMGKLGARELNVSSDIDLIYVYDHDGETQGRPGTQGGLVGQISNQEYFGKMVRMVFGLIGEITEHGFVFRVDLALRPNGNSGPPAVSLNALQEYLQVQGREWERFAWLKSRVIAPTACVANGSAQALRDVVLPFVFRRYLDYNVFDALRLLHRQIREHALRRSAGRPERTHDVKLSRGGIREIEFTVQLLQVVRGGQFPELRTRPTVAALARLAKAGLMPQATAQALIHAYVFLRSVEHRIQYLDDQQTHMLPVADADLAWLAHSMGCENTGVFLCQLDSQREIVAHEFDALLGNGPTDCKTGQCGKGVSTIKGAPEASDIDTVLARLPERFAARVQAWRTHPRVLALREDARHRLIRLVARTGQWLREGTVTEDAALHLADWIEPLLRRESYLALLLERPKVHERLLRLFGMARWPARYLLQHPGVIDELASNEMLLERFDPAEFESDVQRRRMSLQITGEDGDEALLNLLRRAHHAEVFRTLARDVEGQLTVEQVADDLSALALSVLRTTAQWCWDRLKNKHRDAYQFGIIAYGKLGGKELGYGSDLDIVFVYEDDDERAGEVYAALVRKLINWLTVKTGEGDLYEIDTALRPNGGSGMLVSTLAAYATYQQGRGSNTAWTWEHQAMTRARFVLGSAAMGDRFEAIRQTVITAPRDSSALKNEIIAMRNKVRSAHPVKAGLFDVKHSAGGMVDLEFAIQYLVLAHAAAHPALANNLGNIALLLQAQALGLVPAGVGQNAADAYREMRRVQHRARLNEEPTQVPATQLSEPRDAVLALWHAVFEHG